MDAICCCLAGELNVCVVWEWDPHDGYDVYDVYFPTEK